MKSYRYLSILIGVSVASITSGRAEEIELLADGDFEFDAFAVAQFGVDSGGQYLSPAFSTPWQFGNTSAGLFQPDGVDVVLEAPLDGTVGRMVGYTAIYQFVGELWSNTTYTLSFDYQGYEGPGSFFAGVVFGNEQGFPSTDVMYRPDVEGGDLSEGTSHTTVHYNPNPLVGLVGSVEFSFTTAALPSEEAVYVIFEGNNAVPLLIDNVSLTVSAVPEPAAAGAWAGGLALGLAALRRRGRATA